MCSVPSVSFGGTVLFCLYTYVDICILPFVCLFCVYKCVYLHFEALGYLHTVWCASIFKMGDSFAFCVCVFSLFHIICTYRRAGLGFLCFLVPDFLSSVQSTFRATKNVLLLTYIHLTDSTEEEWLVVEDICSLLVLLGGIHRGIIYIIYSTTNADATDADTTGCVV